MSQGSECKTVTIELNIVDLLFLSRSVLMKEFVLSLGQDELSDFELQEMLSILRIRDTLEAKIAELGIKF